MKYELGNYFEMAYDPDFSVVTFSWLLPSLNDLQEEYEELFDDKDYQEILDDIVEGWKQKEFLEYLYDEKSDQFFDEIMVKENRRGTIKDIKLLDEGKRKRLMCWWQPPEWFSKVMKDNNEDIDFIIVEQNVIEALSDRI